jgi:integrase
MLSYYLGGMNPVDLIRVDFSDRDHLKYKRTKTENAVKINPFVEFDIPEEAKPIIGKYIGPDGRLRIFNGKYTSGMISSLTVKFRERNGMANLTFYSARNSFAQHAFQLGISESVIDYILGHSLNAGKKSTIYSYIQVTPAMATDSIRKVCDFIHGDNNFD